MDSSDIQLAHLFNVRKTMLKSSITQGLDDSSFCQVKMHYFSGVISVQLEGV